MANRKTQRTVGNVLMFIGLLLVLTVGGYFAWSEVESAQVRAQLDASAAEAAVRAEQVLTSAAQRGTAAVDARTLTPGAVAKMQATATPAPTRTRPAATRAATRKVAAVNPTAAPTETDVAPTPAPTATPAPIVPVRMVIPDLKIDTKVVEMGWEIKQTKSGPVSEWVIPKNAAGHHLNSATIGQPDNLVISGHNNIYGRVLMPISAAWNNDKREKVDNFTDRSDVLTGREVRLYDAAGTAYTYVITDFYRLKDTGVSQAQRVANGRYILPTGDERVTIVTCWPPTNNTHRLIVIARPEK